MALMAVSPSTSTSLTLPHAPPISSQICLHFPNVRPPFSPYFVAPLKVQYRRSVTTIVGAGPPSLQTKGDGLNKKLEESISEAKEICAGNDTSEECAVAWDEVEEISAAVADKRAKDKGSNDPLEAFCKDHPETDECRVYED